MWKRINGALVVQSMADWVCYIFARVCIYRTVQQIYICWLHIIMECSVQVNKVLFTIGWCQGGTYTSFFTVVQSYMSVFVLWCSDMWFVSAEIWFYDNVLWWKKRRKKKTLTHTWKCTYQYMFLFPPLRAHFLSYGNLSCRPFTLS